VREILLYGVCGGLLVAILKFTEYRFLLVEHSVAQSEPRYLADLRGTAAPNSCLPERACEEQTLTGPYPTDGNPGQQIIRPL